MVLNPIKNYLSKDLDGTESSVTPRLFLQSWRSPFPFQRDKKAPLTISWDDACVPGRAQNCMQRHEYSISISLEKFSMHATDPRSFTPISTGSPQPVFPQREGGLQLIGGSAIGIVTPGIQFNSWWISLVEPLKVIGTVGLHFQILCQEPTTFCSNCSTPRDRLR